MVKTLYTPLSISKKPDPRRLLRPPDSPARSSRKPAKAAAGSCHKLGPAMPVALPVLTISGSGLPLGDAYALTSQLVGQRWPFPMVTGKPEVCRYVPLI